VPSGRALGTSRNKPILWANVVNLLLQVSTPGTLGGLCPLMAVGRSQMTSQPSLSADTWVEHLMGH
jgi:hypothetical protein